MLAGDKVYWPTRESIYVFDSATMRQARQPINLTEMGTTGGNLLIQDGVLVMATADRLMAFNEHGVAAATNDNDE